MNFEILEVLTILRFQNMLFRIKFLIKQEPQKYQENSARLF